MMQRRAVLLSLASTVALGACATTTGPTLGPDGQPLPKLYRVSAGDARRIPFRVLDAVNALRVNNGAPLLALNSRLNAAASTHARDMAIQNRPWHFGSDGSSPIERAARLGYQGRLIGEALSESYESELETVAAWMQEKGPRSVILNPAAQEMGFGFFQEQNGKLWWVMNTGVPGVRGQIPAARASTTEGTFTALPAEDIPQG